MQKLLRDTEEELLTRADHLLKCDIKNILHTYNIDYTELQNTDAVNHIVEEVIKYLSV